MTGSEQFQPNSCSVQPTLEDAIGPKRAYYAHVLMSADEGAKGTVP